jgi:FkbM family methyltransferase
LNQELILLKFGKRKIYLRRDVIDDYWAFNSIFYANTYNKLKLKNSDILLDVGANIGLVTLSYFDKINKIIAIEPETNNFKLLKQNVRINNCKNVITINKGVSNERGYISFEHTGGTATAKPTNAGIEVDTIDNILKEMDVIPTAIKMDIEGYEGKALRGFSGYDDLGQIIMEVHSKKLQNDISKFLTKQGFFVEFLEGNFLHRAIYNVLKHPLTFLKNEKIHDYDLSRRYAKYLLGFSKDRPIEYKTAKDNTDIVILYASKV